MTPILYSRVSSAGIAGDPDVLVVLGDFGERRAVSLLFDRTLPLYAWRYRRLVRRLRRLWVERYGGRA